MSPFEISLCSWGRSKKINLIFGLQQFSYINNHNYLLAVSAWHVDPEPPARSQNILCLYYDQHTGWGLLTKGPIKLYLPTKNSTTVKLLDKCFAMSATNLGGTFDIIMWFQVRLINLMLCRMSDIFAFFRIIP